jgi:3-dehydroquinate synthase
MQRLSVSAPGGRYDILIGPGLLDRLDEWLQPLAPTSIALVSDATVAPLYGARAKAAASRVARSELFVLDASERDKTLGAAAKIVDHLVGMAADRRSVLLALGGGVVGDIAGFAAAIFMRGIRVVQVPTTLLAQVDSSVGGKTGVNHPTGKNLIGAFHQPVAVVADTTTLRSLPPRELSAGLAEILKHGLIADEGYFAATCADMPRLLARDEAALSAAIARSCEIKALVVGRDERESGERALLNFGHTFGHAIEAISGFGTWLHGEAVGCGMCLAADLSRRLGMIGAADCARVVEAVGSANLPVRIAGLSAAGAIQAMRGDKKAEAGTVRFVLLERIGKAVQRSVPDVRLVETLGAAGYT